VKILQVNEDSKLAPGTKSLHPSLVDGAIISLLVPWVPREALPRSRSGSVALRLLERGWF